MSTESLPQGITVTDPTSADARTLVTIEGQHAPAKALRAALLELERSADLKRGTVAINARSIEAAWEILSGELAIAYRDYVAKPASAPRASRATNPWVYLRPALERDEPCRLALRALGATWDQERGEWRVRQAKAEEAQAQIDAANGRVMAERKAAQDRAAEADAKRAAAEAANPWVFIGSASQRDDELVAQLRALGGRWSPESRRGWYVRQRVADQARALIVEAERRIIDTRGRRAEAERLSLAASRRGLRRFECGTGGWYGGRTEAFTKGERLQADGQWWVVVECSGWYVPDGESSVVGGHPTDEGGYAYEAWARPATDDEATHEQERVADEHQAERDRQALSVMTRDLWDSGESMSADRVPHHGQDTLHVERDWTVFADGRYVYVRHLLGIGDDSPWGWRRVERTDELDAQLDQAARRQCGTPARLPARRDAAPETWRVQLEEAFADGQAWDGESVPGNLRPSGLAPDDRGFTFNAPVTGWFGTLRADGSVILTRWVEDIRPEHRLITATAAATLPPHVVEPPVDWVRLPADAVALAGVVSGERAWVRLNGRGSVEWCGGRAVWPPDTEGRWALSIPGGSGGWLASALASAGGQPWADWLLARILQAALDAAPAEKPDRGSRIYHELRAPVTVEAVESGSGLTDGRLVKRRLYKLEWDDGGLEHLLEEVGLPLDDEQPARVWYGEPEQFADTHGPLFGLAAEACRHGYRRTLGPRLANSGPARFVSETHGPRPDDCAPWDVDRYTPTTWRYRVEDYDGTGRAVVVVVTEEYMGPDDGIQTAIAIEGLDGGAL